MKNEIKQLYNLIGIKQALIIEGNVDDIYELNGKYVNIHGLFNEIFADKGYHKRFKFDIYAGFTRLVDDSTNDVVKKTSDSFELFSRLQEILPSNEELIGVLVDYTNFIFSTDANSQEDQMALTAFAKTLKETRFDITEISTLKSCAVFITKQINQLPPDMYFNNADVAILTLPKPNRHDRSQFLNTVKAKLFNIIDILTEYDSLIDYTEGWTLKEISHFIRYVANQNSPAPFKTIINNYLYGNSVSPWQELNHEKLANLKSFLSNKVIGQDSVIQKVVNVITKAALGLAGIANAAVQTKPKGTLFFVGPTGVGKTEMAKAITKFLFGDESNLIRFDMSEYSNETADQKLIGAPPGYVGFEGGGQLTNAIKEKPFSVVLFDEIEKANPKIYDKFLQILEDGRLTDNTGKTVSFSETLIIFTSNIGAASVSPSSDEKSVADEFIKRVQDYFTFDLNRPEILGRIGNNIIPFYFIQNQRLQEKIIEQKVGNIISKIDEKFGLKTTINFNSKMYQYFLRNVDIKRGGRDVINSLEINFIDVLANFIFENINKIYNASQLIIDFDENLQFALQ